MNKKLSVLRRITAVVLCVTLLSSQVVVANAEDSERMNVQTNSEITDISEQDGFSSFVAAALCHCCNTVV